MAPGPSPSPVCRIPVSKVVLNHQKTHTGQYEGQNSREKTNTCLITEMRYQRLRWLDKNHHQRSSSETVYSKKTDSCSSVKCSLHLSHDYFMVQTIWHIWLMNIHYFLFFFWSEVLFFLLAMTLHSHLLSRYHHLTVGKTSLPWQPPTMYYTHEKLFEDKHFLFGCAVFWYNGTLSDLIASLYFFSSGVNE